MWGWPFFFMGYFGLLIWALFIIIGVLVYQDAEKHGMNGVLWFILVIIPWIGIIALILYLVIREERVAKDRNSEDPELILKRRYARGEITREQYLQMMEELKKKDK
jgi:putative membrane protein